MFMDNNWKTKAKNTIVSDWYIYIKVFGGEASATKVGYFRF